MIFPCMELIFVIFHDFQSLWEPCYLGNYMYIGDDSKTQEPWIDQDIQILKQ